MPLRPLLIALLMVCAAGAAAASSAGAAQWVSLGPEGGTVRLLTVDPSAPATIYAASDSGIYKTTDAAATWALAETGLHPYGVRDLVLDPFAPATLYGATADEDAPVYKTVDGATHWTPASTGLEGVTIWALALDPSTPGTLYGAAEADGIFVTRDGGASWTQLATFGLERIQEVAVDPTDPAKLYAASADRVTAGDSRIYRSTDGGVTWTSTLGGATYGLLVDPTDGRIWAADYGVITVSADGGATWTAVIDGLTDTYVVALYLSPLDPGALYAVTNSAGLFRLAPGATTWTLASVGLPSPPATFPNQLVRGVVLSSAFPDLMLVGAIDGVYERGGDGSWTERSRGMTNAWVSAFALDPFEPHTFYAHYLYQPVVAKSTDAGRSWNALPTDFVYVDDFVTDPSTPGRVFARKDRNLFLTEDGGSTWQDSTNDLFVDDRETLNRVAIAPSRPTTMYAVRTFGISKSLDGGVSWQPTGRTPAGNGVNGQLVVDPADPDIVYGGSTQSVLKTTDGGQSWRRLEGGIPFSTWIASIVIDPTNRSTLYAGASVGGHVYSGAIRKSTDAGETWTTLLDGLSSIGELTLDPRDPQRIYAGTGDGALLSTDAGVTWQPLGETAAPGAAIFKLHVHPKAPRTAYASSYARGVMRLTFEPPNAFHCYALRRAAARDAQATLANQLDPAFTARVRAPRQLCLPAAVDGDDRDAPTDASHLVGYDIREVAPVPPRRALRVTNRLGTADVETTAAEVLAVPATAAGTVQTDRLLGAFTCYRTRGRARHPAVALEDRLGSVNAKLKGPVRVCVRTDMTGTEDAEDAADLACYAVRPGDAVALSASVELVDDLGAVSVRPRASHQLCLRSTVSARQ